jgi:hypothetical protein
VADARLEQRRVQPGDDASGVGQTTEDGAQEPGAVLAPFRVSSQPEQVLGCTAGRLILALVVPGSRPALDRGGRHLRHIRQHPRVLAAAPALAGNHMPIFSGNA